MRTPMRADVPLSTRIAHRANVLVWRAPLPHRLQTRLSNIVFSNPPMSAERAVETLAVLQGAGVTHLVMGGWGIDALVGRQRREHGDLDLIVDHRDMGAAAAALSTIGYEEWYRSASEDSLGDLDPLGDAVVFRDAAMRVTDLHPADLRGATSSFASGTIDGHSVPCLSPDQQIRAHHGYRKPWRRQERRGRDDIRIAREMLSADSAQTDE